MNEAQAHIYEFGDFRLDASKHLLLKRDGEPVPLTLRSLKHCSISCSTVEPVSLKRN